MSTPTNHRRAEEVAIIAVQNGDVEVRSDGTVWRHNLRHGRKLGGVALTPITPKRIDTRVHGGYITLRIMINGRRVSCFAHRLVWRHFNGTIPDGLTINHIDGNKANNKPDNLELATYSEQSKHKYRIGLQSQAGDQNAASKLTWEQVREMRRLYPELKSLNKIAQQFGVAYQTVSKIVRGERWKEAA